MLSRNLAVNGHIRYMYQERMRFSLACMIRSVYLLQRGVNQLFQKKIFLNVSLTACLTSVIFQQ